MFAGFQVPFHDANDTLLAVWHTIPFTWYGSLGDLPLTIEEVMERAMEAHRHGVALDDHSVRAS